MSNWIQTVHIQNFKSLRDVSLDCERINIFVGRPNVGKSNLLEALALLGPYFLVNKKDEFAIPAIRYEKMADLFFDQDYRNLGIRVKSEKMSATLSSKGNEFIYEFLLQNSVLDEIKINPAGKFTSRSFTPSSNGNLDVFKKYQFPSEQKFALNELDTFLDAPSGENLLNILRTNKALRLEASSILESYGFEILIDIEENRLEIVKRRDGVLFRTPYSLVADTLRRYLFHIAAIESNRNSVILFEEPEAHNYPPYINRLANRILDNKTNQFFLTTHSPFLLNTLVEEGIKDVAVFMVDFEDFQTKVRRLTEDNLREMLDYGLNIFTQQELFA